MIRRQSADDEIRSSQAAALPKNVNARREGVSGGLHWVRKCEVLISAPSIYLWNLAPDPPRGGFQRLFSGEKADTYITGRLYSYSP